MDMLIQEKKYPEGCSKKTFKIETQCNKKAGSVGWETDLTLFYHPLSL